MRGELWPLQYTETHPTFMFQVLVPCLYTGSSNKVLFTCSVFVGGPFGWIHNSYHEYIFTFLMNSICFNLIKQIANLNSQYVSQKLFSSWVITCTLKKLFMMIITFSGMYKCLVQWRRKVSCRAFFYTFFWCNSNRS